MGKSASSPGERDEAAGAPDGDAEPDETPDAASDAPPEEGDPR
jgi:hypothetical protein